MTKPLLSFLALILAILCSARFDSRAQHPIERSAAAGVARLDDPLPEYITGDECLFCHRFETGQSWQGNRHHQTVRRLDEDAAVVDWLRQHPRAQSIADSAEYLVGGKKHVRVLRRGEAYGQMDMANMEVVRAAGDGEARVRITSSSPWDSRKFNSRCAGCHATQTDSRTQSFAAISLDCYVCHGNATLEHTKEAAKMLFARAGKTPPRVVISACGQCHLRGGRSKATGLPYPNNYVAGDNLFSDFLVDFRRADDDGLNAGDRHIYYNARQVEQGATELTCLSCHTVHAQTTQKHRRLPRSEICFVCHEPGKTGWTKPRYEVHSDVCEY